MKLYNAQFNFDAPIKLLYFLISLSYMFIYFVISYDNRLFHFYFVQQNTFLDTYHDIYLRFLFFSAYRICGREHTL